MTGGRCVEITGDLTVGPSSIDSTAYAGVAAHDAKAGKLVTVLCGAGVHHECPSNGAINAGDPVEANAAGIVTAWNPAAGASAMIGTAVSDASGGRCRFLAAR